MNKTVVIFSLCVAAIIFSFLLFSILAVLFFYWGDTSSVKDALSTVSGIFGGITTIGAAIVGAYLFNDWKEQHNKTVDKEIIFGVIERLNNYLYETQFFHMNITIFIQAIRNNDYHFKPDNMLDFKDSLRDIIVNFENSKRHLVANYSDLEAVMGERKYKEFYKQCKHVCDSADIYTSNLDEFFNQLLQKEFSPEQLEAKVDSRLKIYDFIITSNGGVIDRIKAIKKELSAFYRAN